MPNRLNRNKGYCLKLHVNTFENCTGMCEFIEKDHLPKQTQEEMESLNSPISLKKFSW